MEVKDLRMFIAVVDAAGIRRAATQLNIGQSVVSKRMRDLEDELGVSLFERLQSGARLTHAGKRFDVDIRAVLSRLDDAVRTVGAAGQVDEGQLSIGLSGSISAGFERNLLERWIREYPRVKLEMKEAGPQEQIRAILSREIDVACLTGSTAPVGCDATMVCMCQLYVAVPATSDLAELTEVLFEQLANQHFIVSRGGFGPEIYDLLVKKLSGFGFSPDIEIMDVSKEALMNLVGMDRGVALTSNVSIGVKYPDVTFVPISGKLLPCILVWSPENDNPALRRFVSLAKILAKRELTRDGPSQTPGPLP